MASRSYFYATLCCWILLGSWCPSEEELDNVLDGKSSRSANFIEIHHHFLRSPEILLVKTVRDSLQCAQHCLVIKTCRSFNFGLEADNNGKHLCQLLPWDKFQHSGRYEPSSAFHHYRIASVCENDPCQYGSKCIPVHRTMGYECQCPPQQIGDICQFKVPLWLKVNTREVCFGARNDSFGSFRMQFRGKITSMRLVHLSGNVTCDSTQPNYYSYWGCQNNDRLRTIVTDSRNSRVFPSQTDSKRFYTLHGIKSFSDKLTFYNLTIPLKVEIGQEFRVWYIEDFRNEFESNNNGKTCADVYALYV